MLLQLLCFVVLMAENGRDVNDTGSRASFPCPAAVRPVSGWMCYRESVYDASSACSCPTFRTLQDMLADHPHVFIFNCHVLTRDFLLPFAFVDPVIPRAFLFASRCCRVFRLLEVI